MSNWIKIMHMIFISFVLTDMSAFTFPHMDLGITTANQLKENTLMRIPGYGG